MRGHSNWILAHNDTKQILSKHFGGFDCLILYSSCDQEVTGSSVESSSKDVDEMSEKSEVRTTNLAAQNTIDCFASLFHRFENFLEIHILLFVGL
ncbi:hypothetical protein P3L10_015105 [Capsicum annuum]